MAEHYTLRTVEASAWCAKCNQRTQHRVDNRRKGPCLQCVARLEAEHAERRQQKTARVAQGELF